jgi:RNA polymerase sigma factor (sigma-70 family)
MTTTAARVAGLLAPARDSDANDEELVRRFAADADGAAFGALVRRHGPMVFGVCRRVLRDWHLAEDAFQAAFLVLARRAAAITPPGAVAGWLHGVAYRVSKGARRSALRRLTREKPVAELPDSAGLAPPGDAELREVIDAELQKLPAKYRELLVACDLEGHPRQPVAESLGIPEGTLSSRLTTARKMLADRLARRGIASAIVAAVTANGPVVEACEVPRALAASAARIGSDAAGTVPAHVAALADGAIRAMSVNKLKIAGFALAVVLLGAGVAYAAGLFDAPPVTEPPPPKVPDLVAKPQAAGPNRILYLREGKLIACDPDGKNEKAVSKERGLLQPVEARLSPDGKKLAVRIKVQTPDDPNPDDPPRFWLYVRELGEKEPGTWLDVYCDSFAWSADGTEIAYTGPGDRDRAQKEPPLVHGIVKVATKKTTPIKLPKDHVIIDWSGDGKHFVTIRANDRDLPTLHLVTCDGKQEKRLTEEKRVSLGGRFSPDGKRLLYSSVIPENLLTGEEIRGSVGKLELWVLDFATGKSSLVAGVPAGGDPSGFCWSPDGKRIAYVWREFTKSVEGNPAEKEEEVRLIVCDADGKNAAKLASWKVKGLQVTEMGGVDWR